MNNKANGKLKILLVDDQYLFLESLKIVLENIAEDIEVVGTAGNGEEAVRFLENTGCEKPVDAVLMDVRMEVMDGVTASKILHQKYPLVHIIMLTTFEDDSYVREAMANGAAGYLLKNIAPKMLVSAVRAVCDGSVIMDPNVAGSLLQAIVSQKGMNRNLFDEQLPDWFYELNAKERQIIKEMLLGKNNKEIAYDIHVGEQTIRNYISALYDKLGVPGRWEMLKKVRQIPAACFY
jgi:Response regulator containing a CheY-like receiver domain and an HTH DNA-binding domain